MADHARFVALAQRLIKENGREITLVRLSGERQDADKPWRGTADVSGGGSSRITIYGVFIPPSGVSELGLSIRTIDLLKDSDQVLLCSPGAQEDISEYHQVDDPENDIWSIDHIDILRPGTVTILAILGISQ